MNKEITINGEKYIKAECKECEDGEEKSPYEFDNMNKTYILNGKGGVDNAYRYIDSYQNGAIKQGNVFRTREEAGHERDRRKAIHKIKKYIYDNFGYDPTDWADWENFVSKYVVSYDNDEKEFAFDCYYNFRYYSPIGYLKTKEQGKVIIDNFEDELKIIFNINE